MVARRGLSALRRGRLRVLQDGAQTLAQPDVQKRLAENVYRQATLGPLAPKPDKS